MASTLCSELGKGATSKVVKYLLMRVGVVHSILLLHLVARCIETIDVCIWHMFVFMSVVVVVCGFGVCGNVCCVAAVVKDSVFLAF